MRKYACSFKQFLKIYSSATLALLPHYRSLRIFIVVIKILQLLSLFSTYRNQNFVHSPYAVIKTDGNCGSATLRLWQGGMQSGCQSTTADV